MFQNLPPIEILIAAGFTGLVLWLVLSVRLDIARPVLAVILFFAAIGARISDEGVIENAGVLSPLQLQRSNIFLGLCVILGAASLSHLGRVGFHLMSRQGLLLLLIGLLQGFVRLFHEGAVPSLISMAFTLATILPLALVIPGLLEQKHDWIRNIRIIAWANLLYLVGCGFTMVLSPDALTMTAEDRFNGLSTQPITAAIFLSVGCMTSLWLIMHDSNWRLRPLWIAMAGLDGVLVIGTGSRTGLLLLAIGIAAILYRRIGRTALLGPFAVAAVFGALSLFEYLGFEFAFARVFTIDDTRSVAWASLLHDGLNNPVFGVGTGAHSLTGTQYSENSYLYGFASFGISMLLLLLFFLASSIRHCVQLFFAAWSHPKWAPIIDIVIAYNVIYFALSPIDGGMLSRADQGLVTMLLISGLSGRLMHDLREGVLDEGEEEARDSEEDGMVGAQSASMT